MQHHPDGPYIFISYASADRERVLPLVDALARAGVAVWIDREGIHGGANYGREIAEAIKGAAALVLMASTMSLASRNVKQEIAVAWEYERPYLPLLLELVAIPDDVKYWLTAAQWVEVLDKPEQEWLPPVVAALAPLGIAPKQAAEQEPSMLAGRERELALLRERLVTAKEGTGGLVLIGGEAGIGKTTLAEAGMQEAERTGFVLLEGHCFDLAETPPYGPWIDLFARFQPSPSWPILPEAFAMRGTVGAVQSQMALFVQVQDFLSALSRQQPVVMLLDDLHWSDPASLDLLRYLARSLATFPLLALVTYRSDELTRKHPLYALLPQLAREAGAQRIDLGRLDDDAVRTLLAERYGLSETDSTRLAAYLQGRAEGNALFVGELLRSLEEGGALRHVGDEWRLGDLNAMAVPTPLKQVIDARIARLDEEGRRLLEVAAVIGHTVPYQLWAAAAAADEGTVLDLVERAEAAQVVAEEPGGAGMRFAHALVREALYEGLASVRRRRLHRTVAEALAAGPHSDPDAVAYQFQRAGDGRAAEWLIRAGERAQRAYAWPTAAARYEAALPLMEAAGADATERGWLLYRIAMLRRFVDMRGSMAACREVERLAAEAGDAVLEAYARFSEGHLLNLLRAVQPTLWQDALSLMEAGLAAIERARDGRDQRGRPSALDLADAAVGWGTLLAVHAYAGRFTDALRLGERYRERVGDREADSTPGNAANAAVGLAIAHAHLGAVDAAADAFAEGRRIVRASNYWVQMTHCLAFESTYLALPYRADDGTTRRRLAADAEEAWAKINAIYTSAPPDAVAVQAAVMEGRWEYHPIWEEPAQEALESMVNAAAQAEIATARGEADAAWGVVRRVLPDEAATEPDRLGFANANGTLFARLAVVLCLDANDLTTARAWLAAYERGLAWSGAVLGQSEGQALWARYYRQTGDMGKAREHAGRALVHATAPRQPLALLAAHRLLGELDTDAGRYEEAARHLDASLALADACQAPYERALTLLALAELRAATGDTDAARTLLAEVRAICGPLGAKPALARADALATRLTVH